MAIAEAKFENAQRTLEADLHAQMEKEVSLPVNFQVCASDLSSFRGFV